MPSRPRRPRSTLTEALQAAVEASGQSLYAISKETGIAQSILSRFMSNTTRLRLDHADALAAHLGLELRSARKSKRD
jgi:transcriptional regulator with XRE-family HTH domain